MLLQSGHPYKAEASVILCELSKQPKLAATARSLVCSVPNKLKKETLEALGDDTWQDTNYQALEKAYTELMQQ